MTHRKGEDFSLIKLTDIKDNTASGTTISPFINFKPDFIEEGTRTKLKGTNDIPANMYGDINAVGFFDSLHDFKNNFIDSQGQIKGDKDNITYKKFLFSFLLKGGYTDLMTFNPIISETFIQDKYSYLNRIPRPLNQDNLENYFSLGNIFKTIRDKLGTIHILPNTRSGANLTDVYNKLVNFFQDYKDPNFGGSSNFGGSIKLMVDMQLNLFNIIQRRREGEIIQRLPPSRDFSILYSAETIIDSAPKSKADTINTVFGCENWYIEHLSGERVYDWDDIISTIKGNVQVKFSNIEYSKQGDLEKSDYTVGLAYKYNNTERWVEQVPVIMNKKQTTKDAVIKMIRNFIDKTLKEMGDFSMSVTDFNESAKDRNIFYTDFNSEYNTNDDILKNNAFFYARKRLGDTLQGRVCKKDKLKDLTFKKVTKNGSKYVILNSPLITATKSAVLVTHDRMLFSYAIINKIPVILDLEHNMIIYKPNPLSNEERTPLPDEVRTGGGGDEPLQSENSYNFDIKKEESVLLPHETEVQIGGLHFGEDMHESIFENIDDFIRFLYFRGTTIPNFKEFLTEINNGLSDNSLKYSYIGEYKHNVLIIGTDEYIAACINEMNKQANKIRDDYLAPQTRRTQDEDREFITVPYWIMIENGNKHLHVTRTIQPAITVQFKYDDNNEVVIENLTTVNIYDKNNLSYNEDFGDGSMMVQHVLQEMYPDVRIQSKNVSQYLKEADISNIDNILNDISINIPSNTQTPMYTQTPMNTQTENSFRNIIISGVCISLLGSSMFFGLDNTFNTLSGIVIPAALVAQRKYLNVSSTSTAVGATAAAITNLVAYGFGAGSVTGNLSSAAIGTIAAQGTQLYESLSGETERIASKNSRGGGGSDLNLYELILNSNFDLLNNPDILLQNNITVITFLFELLHQYEVSFINYEEAIDTFYTKIDETYILGDMIGVNNWIPHNIEFYVFLKLVLKEYTEKTLNTYNYALFEYYLFFSKSKYDIYTQFQNIKSYLLDSNYKITIPPPEIIEEIGNTPSMKYFFNLIRRASGISKQIIEQNYNASQDFNYDIIYKNVNDYSLKLCGFTEMKNEFISKTYEIIQSMLNKGLLLQYVSTRGSEYSKSSNDTSSSSDLNSSQYKSPQQIPIDITSSGGKKIKLSKRRYRKKNKFSKKKGNIKRKQTVKNLKIKRTHKKTIKNKIKR